MTNEAMAQAAAKLAPEEIEYIKGKNAQVAQPEPTQAAAAAPAPDATAPAVPAHAQARRKRQKVQHSWPPEGAVLKAVYFKTEYRATVVPATKRLKSGRQLRIDTGPAAGKVCDSLSEAMLLATAAQRAEQKLNRKGASNGWLFWRRTRS